MKKEYSTECEDCGCYNISPVKCEACWEKEFRRKFIKEFIETWCTKCRKQNNIKTHNFKITQKEIKETNKLYKRINTNLNKLRRLR